MFRKRERKVEVVIVGLDDLQKLFKTVLETLSSNNLKLDQIMAEQKEAAAQLRSIKEQLAKAISEIQAKIQTLVDAANNADDVAPELQAAIDDLVPAAQQLDDIVPDAPTEPPAEPEG